MAAAAAAPPPFRSLAGSLLRRTVGVAVLCTLVAAGVQVAVTVREENARFVERYAEGFSAIDFRRFSKAANPKLVRYDFDFGQFLR